MKHDVAIHGSSKRARRAAQVVLLGTFGSLAADAQQAVASMVTGQDSPRPRQVLFLGRQVNSHHDPGGFHSMMRQQWAERNIRMKFTIQMSDLNATTFAQQDALFAYGNAFYFEGPQTALAIEAFANAGGGVAVMHVGCWSYTTDVKWTQIVGGGFYGHYAFTEFTQEILDVDHPILKGLGTYTSVDEPYQFRDLSPDRTILTVRNGPGPRTEMTWVRMQGLGRVFYHSGGHDARTWVQPNFQEIITRGIEWVSKTGDGPPVAAIDRARIGNGGAVAVRASLDGPGEELLDAIFVEQGGTWYRPVLEGEVLYDTGSGSHAPQPGDVLRVGGQTAVPVMALGSKFNDAAQVSRWGLWTGRGGMARVAAQEEGWLSWGSGYLPVVAPPAGATPELVMNAAGTTVAQVFVTREGFPELDTALIRSASGTGAPSILLVEGEDPALVGGPWVCGDLSTARLSLNGPGHLAAILPGTGGKRLMIDSGSGWTSLLATGEGVPGLAGGATLDDLREVRLNDAGSLMVAARINASGTILRRAVGATDWSALVTDGPQPWLAEGESLVLPADGKGCLIDAGSNVWLLATIAAEGVNSRCLLKISPAGSVDLMCREGGTLALAGQAVAVTALGPAEDWSCGPAGMACGRVTVTPPGGTAGDVLVRWNGKHALPAVESGAVFHEATGDFTVAGFRLDGGGTAEDGKGGFVTSGGEWVAVATAAGGGDRLIHGSSLADLDGDGRDDLLEDALGGNPALPDATPLLGIEPVPAGARLQFLKKTGGPFSYQIESSTNLTLWLPAAVVPNVSADQSGVPAGFQRMEFTLGGGSGFARVRVEPD